VTGWRGLQGEAGSRGHPPDWLNEGSALQPRARERVLSGWGLPGECGLPPWPSPLGTGASWLPQSPPPTRHSGPLGGTRLPGTSAGGARQAVSGYFILYAARQPRDAEPKPMSTWILWFFQSEAYKMASGVMATLHTPSNCPGPVPRPSPSSHR